MLTSHSGPPPLIHLPSLASTNDYLLELTRRESWPSGTVVWADEQTRGRGQKGSNWESSPGENLTFSVLWYPHFLAARQAFRLSKVVSLALQEVISRHLPGQPVIIKWPNDLLVGSGKAAGILIENQLEGQKLRQSIIGVGLNVNQTNFPAEWSSSATSMKMVVKNHPGFDREALLQEVLLTLEQWYDRLRIGEGVLIDQAYLQKLFGYQEKRRFADANSEFEGVIYGVDESGRLAIDRQGQIEYFEVKSIRQLL